MDHRSELGERYQPCYISVMKFAVSNAPNKWRWYVYELRDPRCGSTFYVGKGMKKRMYGHVIEARTGKYSDKCNRIREIESAGFSVIETEVARFSDEKLAFAHEADRIVDYGLDNLTNVIPGGTGAYERYARARKAKNSKETPESVVRSCASQIKSAIVLHVMGYTAKWRGADFIEIGAVMGMGLRDKVGADFFDKHVFGVEPCHS